MLQTHLMWFLNNIFFMNSITIILRPMVNQTIFMLDSPNNLILIRVSTICFLKYTIYDFKEILANNNVLKDMLLIFLFLLLLI